VRRGQLAAAASQKALVGDRTASSTQRSSPMARGLLGTTLLNSVNDLSLASSVTQI